MARAVQHSALPVLISRDGGLALLYSDGHYRPLLWHGDGPAIDALLPGWHGDWVFAGFAPLLLLELSGPAGRRATWFIDENGVKLGDAVAGLPATSQGQLCRGLRHLFATAEAATLETRARYQRITEGTRLQLEALLPNATYDRGLELAQGIAARTDIALRPAIGVGTSYPHGWSEREVDGVRVRAAVGRRSLVRFDDVPLCSSYYLSLSLAEVRTSRRLRLSAGGRLLAINPLHERFHQTCARFGYWIASELVRDGSLDVGLEHGLIASSRDEAFLLGEITLELGDPLEQSVSPDAGSLDDAALMGRFQSLGDNCQFGFVQRHFGAEPMGLMRFAGVPDLIGMLDARLRGLGDPGTVGQLVAGIEYQIHESRYGMFYHSFRNVGSVTPEALIAENEIKLRYLARKLIEDLEDGETIWMTRRIVSNDVSEIFALHAALRRYGPNRLLWVTPAPADRKAGEVEWISRDILRGYLAADAENDPTAFSPSDWLAVCRAAFAAFAIRDRSFSVCAR